MNWDDLRIFQAVARNGSLTLSARELRVSQSTVSRRIAALERHLKTTLFARHSAGYTLTDDGRDLAVRMEPIEPALRALETETAGRAASLDGTVRLATAQNIADYLIVPRMLDFSARHEKIVIEVASDVRTTGLSRREADIALRLTRPEHGNLVVRKLVRQAHALYIRHDHADVENPRIIGWVEEFAHLPIAEWIERTLQGAAPALLTSGLATQLAAVRAGLGAAVLPCFMGDEESTLCRLIGPSQLPAQDLLLIVHGDVARSARVRAVADFLADNIIGQRALIEGNQPSRTHKVTRRSK